MDDPVIAEDLVEGEAVFLLELVGQVLHGNVFLAGHVAQGQLAAHVLLDIAVDVLEAGQVELGVGHVAQGVGDAVEMLHQKAQKGLGPFPRNGLKGRWVREGQVQHLGDEGAEPALIRLGGAAGEHIAGVAVEAGLIDVGIEPPGKVAVDGGDHHLVARGAGQAHGLVHVDDLHIPGLHGHGARHKLHLQGALEHEHDADFIGQEAEGVFQDLLDAGPEGRGSGHGVTSL